MAENIYYGHPSELNDNILLDDSGKTYNKIVVNESNEPLVNFDSIKNPRIRHISEFHAYYTMYVTDPVMSKFIRKGVVDMLVKMLEYLPKNIGIIYVEGYLSQGNYNSKLGYRFNKAVEDTKDPVKAYKIASAGVPESSLTGGTLSLALYNMDTNKMLELDDTHEMGARDATFAPNATQEHKANRVLLLTAATKAGFVHYANLWWYFAVGEKMHAYVKDKESCEYGPVNYNLTTNSIASYQYNPLTQVALAEACLRVKTIQSVEELDKYNTSDSLVILKTTTNNCIWCDKIKFDYGFMSQEFPKHVFLEANVRNAPDIAAKFEIKSNPTFIILYKGMVMDKHIGSDITTFKFKLQNIISSMSKPVTA